MPDESHEPKYTHDNKTAMKMLMINIGVRIGNGIMDIFY